MTAVRDAGKRAAVLARTPARPDEGSLMKHVLAVHNEKSGIAPRAYRE
jgi:hypothetical protein